MAADAEGVAVPIDVRPAGDRYESRGDLVTSRHSFAFGPHYDPANTRLGPLVAHNDDLLQPGGGFPEHPHRDLDIVTWVIEGALAHTDSAGGAGIVLPGAVGYLHTGAGVRHDERNASSGDTRSVQMWLIPDAVGPASYAVVDVSAELAKGGFVLVASGSPADHAPIKLRCALARFRVARLAAGDVAELASSAFMHVFVARGDTLLDDVPLTVGDAARVTDGSQLRVAATTDAEVLAWAFADRR